MRSQATPSIRRTSGACSKGAALGQTVTLDGRLLTPRIHGRDAEWDEALDLIAAGIRGARSPDAVAIYGSGQLLTEDYYVANKLMKGFIGAANIDTNSRLCMASSVAGHRRAFSADTVPGTYEDLEEADLVVLVGSNLAWCHPVLYQRLAAAKSARPALKVVTIDPDARRPPSSPTCISPSSRIPTSPSSTPFSPRSLRAAPPTPDISPMSPASRKPSRPPAPPTPL